MITPIYAGFFGLMLVILSWHTAKLKQKHDAHHHHKMNQEDHNELTAAVRAQANIVEYLPIALLLMWMLEEMHVAIVIINSLGMLMIVARLMHLHGLKDPSGNGLGRKIGTRLTWLQITISSLLCLAAALNLIGQP